MSYIEAVNVPEIEYKIIARSALKCIQNYFDDPEHEKEFQEWKAQKECGGDYK